jgi:tetratricopeptide (TPR) repeat protein
LHVRRLPALLLLFVASVARAAPLDDLRAAEHAYIYGDYRLVIDSVRPLVEPNILLAAATDQVRAYELLGLAHFYLGEKDEARKAFERLIRLDPEHRLDPLVVPPAAIDFYDKIQSGLAGELRAEREAFERRRREEEEAKRRANTVEIQREYRRNSKLVAVMPFGIGQFQNGDVALGATFLASELAAIGLSVGFFVAVEDLRQTDGRVAHADLPRAESMQRAQLISGGAAVGLMILGAAHALLTFKDETTVQERTIRPGPGPAGAPAGLSLEMTW